MSFGSILYALLFQPLQILFEAIYKFAYSIIQNKGVAIIILSLAMNFWFCRYTGVPTLFRNRKET